MPWLLPEAAAINPWIVAVAVVIPTFMEVLDTTVANVALRYIAGGLSAAQTDSEWVITSYLAANAIVLPISGWLSGQLGRRNYFLMSIAVFTLASMRMRHQPPASGRSFSSVCCRDWPAAVSSRAARASSSIVFRPKNKVRP